MKLTTTLLATAAAVLGLGGAATAYQMAAAPSTTVQPVSQTTADEDSVDVVVPRIEQGVRFRWAPCEPPAVQRGDHCVTEVVRTVVLGDSSGGSGSSGGSSDGAAGDSGDDHSDEAAHEDDHSDEDAYEDDEGEDDEGEDHEDHEDEDEPEHDE